MSRVLLLNSSYEPLHICSWKRAIILLVKGKAETVVRNRKEIGGGWRMPLVIRLLYYIKIPHKDIPLTRRNIMHRDNYTCQYCGKKNDLTIDHIIPRSKGGRTTWQNVITACAQCNLAKGNRLPEDAGMFPSQRPFRPNSFHLQEIGRAFPPNYLHDSWRDYLYWDTELDPL